MAGEAILVVDDNLLNIKLARAVLAHAGYEVHSAADAATAFAQLEVARPQLIIMDLMLPDMDGCELARKIKHDARYSDIPIIAMTASDLADDEERARLAGCDDYIAKPFEIGKLISTIARYVRPR
jgi:two-component system cell cycle response regulator DivK